MIKTNYIGHDLAYQHRRNNPEYAGWSKQEEVAETWREIWQPLIENRAFPKHGQLLELGCGAGNLSIAFAQAGYDVTGIDIAPTAISWATENAAKANVNATFLLGDVLNLANLADDSFDILVDGHCFHCIIGGDRAQFLQSAHRVLKVGGILTICTMCNEVPDTEYFREHFDDTLRCAIHDGVATRYIGDSNDIIQEVIDARFKILDIQVIPPEPDKEGDLADLRLIAECR